MMQTTGSAVISDDEYFRYTLRRDFETDLLSPPRSICLWVMLNPSTADASIDDNTIVRCCNFAAAWDHTGISVANLYAFRSTRPIELGEVHDPIGPECDRHISELAVEADRIVVAWGADTGPVHSRADDVLRLLRGHGKDLWCLGLTAQRKPRHPLYVSGQTEPVLFTEDLDD